MQILRQLKDSKGRPMRLYLCRQDEKTLLFKEINDSKIIQYELLVQKLAEKLSVRTLKLYSIRGKGILMDYHKDSNPIVQLQARLKPHTEKRITKDSPA